MSFAKEQTDGVVMEESPMIDDKFETSHEIPGAEGIVMENFNATYHSNSPAPTKTVAEN